MSESETHEGLSRSQFLAGAIGTGVAAATGVFAAPAAALGPAGGATAPAPVDPGEALRRAYTAGRFALEVDGKLVGELQGASDDGPTGLVIDEPSAGGAIVKKHIANVKWNECKAELGMGLDRGVYDWIEQSFKAKSTRKNGAIIAADFRGDERLAFTDAIITGLGMPALDAASKDAAKMTVTFAMSAPTQRIKVKFPTLARKQKQWVPANFRVNIDGVDTRRVTKVDAFSIKQKFSEVGEGAAIEPTKVEFPDMAIYVPEGSSSAASLQAWFNDFVVAGNAQDNSERSGTIEYLAPDNRTVLATIALSHVGIFKLTPEKVEAGTDAVRRIKAELYVEEMTVRFN